jgi:hypothetical protein
MPKTLDRHTSLPPLISQPPPSSSHLSCVRKARGDDTAQTRRQEPDVAACTPGDSFAPTKKFLFPVVPEGWKIGLLLHSSLSLMVSKWALKQDFTDKIIHFHIYGNHWKKEQVVNRVYWRHKIANLRTIGKLRASPRVSNRVSQSNIFGKNEKKNSSPTVFNPTSQSFRAWKNRPIVHINPRVSHVSIHWLI